MADIHVRNVRAVTTGSSQSVEKLYFWMLRELFMIGRWQEIAVDASAEWTAVANVPLDKGVVAGTADLAVTAAAPHVVTSASGGFDPAHEGLMLTLLATNDANRGLYNIRYVKDANTLYVDQRTRTSVWADEGSMAGRIHQGSQGDGFDGTSQYLVVQAPAASGRSLQLHFTHNSTTILYCVAYPKGDYAGAANATDQVTLTMGNYYTHRINAFFADSGSSEFYSLLAFLGATGDAEGIWYRIIGGELTDVAVGDDYPGFISMGTAWDALGTVTDYLTMLNELDASVRFYPTFYKQYEGANVTTIREKKILTKKINGGLAKVFRPLLLGENTPDGGFPRGNTPYSFCSNKYGDGEFGTAWWKMAEHFLLPRNGSTDLLPINTGSP